jgi:hypothetical protein
MERATLPVVFGSSTFWLGGRKRLSSGGLFIFIVSTAACGHVGLDLSEGATVEGSGGSKVKKEDKGAGGIGTDAGGSSQSAGGSLNGTGGWLAGGRTGQCREGQSDADGDCIPSGGCQGDELQGPTGDCYFFIKELLSYEVAGERCASRGADWSLAAVRSEEENEFILSHLQEESWIGGGGESEEGSYRWTRGDEVFWEGGNEGQARGDRFSYWSDDQPSTDVAGELCMIYRRSGDSFAWALTSCDDTAGVVCQGLPES